MIAKDRRKYALMFLFYVEVQFFLNRYLNYGSIGSFVGHEISHASMPRYDFDENLLEPWNHVLLKSFLSKANCFVEQYSAYFDEESEMNVSQLFLILYNA